jgi:hypothetical protein
MEAAANGVSRVQACGELALDQDEYQRRLRETVEAMADMADTDGDCPPAHRAFEELGAGSPLHRTLGRLFQWFDNLCFDPTGAYETLLMGNMLLAVHASRLPAVSEPIVTSAGAGQQASLIAPGAA